jgi:hypothetical protein
MAAIGSLNGSKVRAAAAAAIAADEKKVHFKFENIMDDLATIAAARTDKNNYKLEIFNGRLRPSRFGCNTRDAKSSGYSRLGNFVSGATQAVGAAVRGIIIDENEVILYINELIEKIDEISKRVFTDPRTNEKKEFNFFGANPGLTSKVIESLKNFANEGSAKKELAIAIEGDRIDYNIGDIGTEFMRLAQRVEEIAKKSPDFVAYQREQNEDADGFVKIDSGKIQAGTLAEDAARKFAGVTAAGAAGAAGAASAQVRRERRPPPAALDDFQADLLKGMMRRNGSK